jgi:preprotein translocase subunit YajC
MLTSFAILAQAAPNQTTSLFSGPILPFICIGVIFYFLIIRPQSKRQKELANLVSNLKTGDKVVTSGGIHGIIANVKEGNTLILKVADNVKIEIDKSAVATVVVDKNATDKSPVLTKS